MKLSEAITRWRNLNESTAQIKSDTLQNEILLILHHVGDAEKAINEKDLSYVKRSLVDIRESANRLSKFVAPGQKQELDRATKED